MYKFAKRVRFREFAELLSQIETKDYALLTELKRFVTDCMYYYDPKREKPNIMVDGRTYELTDEGVICYSPTVYDSDSDSGLHVQPSSRIIGQSKVREFYVRKFGQEYLDFLVGPGVATLTNEFRALRRRDAEEEKRTFEERQRTFEEKRKQL